MVNFGYGITDYSRGLAISFGGSRIRQNMRGWQLSGLFSLNDGGGKGIQMSGIYGRSSGEVRGAEVAGVAQVMEGDMRGISMAGAVVYGESRADGITMAGAFAHAGAVEGVEAAGAVSVAKAMVGLQVAGAVSVADSLNGLQVAGAVNVVDGPVNGFQVSIVNIGGNVRGAQIGIVNVAQVVHGTQVGVVNISQDMYGAPIGVFNYVRNAGLGAELSSSGTEPLNVALRYDPHHTFYTYLAFGMMGFDNVAHGDAYYGLGFGAHAVKIGQVGIDVDVMAADPYLAIKNDKNDLLVRERLMATCDVAPHFTMFAGVSYEQYMGWSHQDNQDINTSLLSTVHHTANGDFTLRMWPQLFAGIRI